MFYKIKIENNFANKNSTMYNSNGDFNNDLDEALTIANK